MGGEDTLREGFTLIRPCFHESNGPEEECNAQKMPRRKVLELKDVLSPRMEHTVIHVPQSFEVKVRFDGQVFLRKILNKRPKKHDTTDVESNQMSMGRLFDTAFYIFTQNHGLRKEDISKAMYHIQGFVYAFTGKYFFDEDCIASSHGPRYEGVYNYFRYRRGKACAVPHPIIEESEEKEIIDIVAKLHSIYSGSDVANMIITREEPWKETMNGFKLGRYCHRVLTKERIGKYFSGIKEFLGLEEPSNIVDYFDRMVSTINHA